jgi:hypothetical protein
VPLFWWKAGKKKGLKISHLDEGKSWKLNSTNNTFPTPSK